MFKKVLFLSFFVAVGSMQAMYQADNSDGSGINNQDSRISMRLLQEIRSTEVDKETLEFINHRDNSVYEFINNSHKTKNIALIYFIVHSYNSLNL